MGSTDTLEDNRQPAAIDADGREADAAQPSHGHDPAHGQEDGGHGHSHGPVLNPECTRELVLDVSAEEVSKAYSDIAAKYRKYARIPGFRAGKVPDSVVRRRFASDIRKEAIDRLLPERFNNAVAELGVRPVGQPQVTELSVEDGKPLQVKAVFEYLVPFSIEGYGDIAVPKPSVELTEEEFREELERLRESRATFEPVEEDRALKSGDWAQIGYKGTVVGDAEPEPIQGENTLVEIGAKDTFEGFSAALEGARPGQELKAEVSYPHDYPDGRLAGKTVAYEIEVTAIKQRILPELNEEFATAAGGYKTLAELEDGLRARLSWRKKRRLEAETKDALFAALAAKYTFPVPESLVQVEIDRRLDRGLRALAGQGMSTEQMRKLDFARLRAAQRESAIADVRTSVLLDRIAQEEKIAVSDEEMDAELRLAANESGEPLDGLKARLTADGGMARIREQLRREKTASVLYERLPA